MFRTLFQVLTFLGTLTLVVWVVDELLRADRSTELTANELNEEEAEFLDNLIAQHGEGFSVYNNEESSGFLIVPPPFEGLMAWFDEG